jgi:hypothetical protein
LWDLGLWLGGLRLRFGGGREAVVVVLDGITDGFAPAVRAESVNVFVPGNVDGLHESLDQVGDGVSGLGLYIAADYGGDEVCQTCIRLVCRWVFLLGSA